MTSDEQLEWELNAPEGQREHPAMQFLHEEPSLPRVLIIGDSISIGYTLSVREKLKGRANLIRPYQNCIGTVLGLKRIDEWLGRKRWDLIHFNWGLHDLKYLKDDRLDLSGERDTVIDDYENNLRELVAKLQQKADKLIWATTTPVPEGAAGRVKGDEIEYNRVAEGIMRENNIPINDLYSAVLPDLDKYQIPADVHFNEKGYDYLAGVVADKILEYLP